MDRGEQKAKKHKRQTTAISNFSFGLIRSTNFHPLDVLATAVRLYDEAHQINRATESTTITSIFKNKTKFYQIIEALDQNAVTLQNNLLCAPQDQRYDKVDRVISSVLHRQRADIAKVKKTAEHYIRDATIQPAAFYDWIQLTLKDAVTNEQQWSDALLLPTRLHKMQHGYAPPMLQYLQTQFADFNINEGQRVYDNGGGRNNNNNNRTDTRGRGRGRDRVRGGGRRGDRGARKDNNGEETPGQRNGRLLRKKLAEHKVEEDRSICFFYNTSGCTHSAEKCRNKHHCHICRKGHPTMKCTQKV